MVSYIFKFELFVGWARSRPGLSPGPWPYVDYHVTTTARAQIQTESARSCIVNTYDQWLNARGFNIVNG